MRIAVFDYRVTSANPVGSCHRRLLSGLCGEHDFTVFAVEFENPCPERIQWVRIPLPVRPYVLLYILFHLVAPLVYAWHCMVLKKRFDLVQIVESNLCFGDISYSHFCHRQYLARHWRDVRGHGVKAFARGLAHRAAALMEPWVYRTVDQVVVPSRGLSAELSATYPVERERIHLVANPVDIERLAPPGMAERARGASPTGPGSARKCASVRGLGSF